MEKLIQSALRQDAALGAKLARWAGKPAVFYQTAPMDTDRGWRGPQFPRVDFAADWTYDPARKTNGALAVNVWCLDTADCPSPESLGDEVRRCLTDLFLTDGAGDIYALAWQRTDAFEAGGQLGEPLTIGVTLSFDVLAFPVQVTTEPDPAQGLMDYIKGVLSEAVVVGADQLQPMTRPTAEAPLVYVRITQDGSAMRNSYAVAWMTVTAAIHVFSPDHLSRQLVCRQITNRLALDGECRLRDGSPMLIKRLALTAGADPLRQGQIMVTGQYGVLRQPEKDILLNHAHWRGVYDSNGKR